MPDHNPPLATAETQQPKPPSENEEQPSSEPQQPREEVRGYKIPSDSDYVPPAFSRRPNLFDEVELGPLPPKDDIQRAYILWKLQDDTLAVPSPSNRPTSRSNGPYACLVRNIYQRLMEDFLLPSGTCNKVAQYRQTEDGSSLKGWSYEEIFGPDANEANTTQTTQPSISINGHDVLTDRYWTKPKIQAELRRRNLNPIGIVRHLRELLYEDEAQNTRVTDQDVDKGSLLLRQGLPEWGIRRKEDYMLKISAQKDLSPLDMYTWAVLLNPYNPGYWTSRAFLYYQMGHYDLAIGDAYRAQLLCEVLVNPLSRNGQPGLYIRVWDAVERHILQIRGDGDDLAPEIELMRKPNGINDFIPDVRKCIHHIISLSLLAMQCWEDYAAAEPHLRTRLVMPDRDANAVRQREGRLREFIKDSIKLKRNNESEYLFERHYGSIPAQDYPYEANDIMPATDMIAERINKEVLDKSQTTALPPRQFKIDIDDLKQVCALATENIPAGSIIYTDEPSVRGHLHPAKDFPHQRRCENCKREVTVPSRTASGTSQSASPAIQSNAESSCYCTKSKTESIFWCPKPSSATTLVDTNGEPGPSRKKRKTNNDISSYAPSCLEIAKSLYHNKACGKDWSWLHDAMRPTYWEGAEMISSWARLSHTNEKHGTLLSLLLREVFDITLLRRETDGKPNLLAHEIDELMPIILDQAQDIPSFFPFSFAANVRVPFDILSCLGVNIFRDLTFDTWVIQIVLRKLLMAVVPWYSSQDPATDIPESQAEKKRRTKRIIDLVPEEFPEINPSHPDLYVFPILSMFRNRCPPHQNVDWFWDTTIPNRIILRTSRDIRAGEELFIGRTKRPFTRDTRYRLLAKPCSCSTCLKEAQFPNTIQTEQYGHAERSESPEIVIERVTPFSDIDTTSESESEDEEQADPAPEDKPTRRLSPGRVSELLKTIADYDQSPAFSPVTRASEESDAGEVIDEEEQAEREQLHEMARQIHIFKDPMYPEAQNNAETARQALAELPQSGSRAVPNAQPQQTETGQRRGMFEVPPSPDWDQSATLEQKPSPDVEEEPQPRHGPRIKFGGRFTRRSQYNQASPGARDRERANYLKRQREE